MPLFDWIFLIIICLCPMPLIFFLAVEVFKPGEKLKIAHSKLPMDKEADKSMTFHSCLKLTA